MLEEATMQSERQGEERRCTHSRQLRPRPSRDRTPVFAVSKVNVDL